MEVPRGFAAVSWSFLSFLPFFFSLLILGVIKSLIIGPIVLALVFIGNSSVSIGLWPAHAIWTWYCVTKTKRLGLVLKILVSICLPVPLVLWLVLSILGSFLGGFGYGYFAPLVATFEAVGEDVMDKLYHCFADGCWSTIEGACTAVRDFTDFCFHSYFDYMDDLTQKVEDDEKPYDIKLSKLPSCLLVCLLSIPIDVPMITLLALWKSPYMLLIGWHRLFHDLIGREGPFLETVCVPFAALAIILWPVVVVGSILIAFFCSFALGCYGGVVVYQEQSFRMGLSYLISVISMFDEYANDLLYLREGSCFPRLQYRKNKVKNPPHDHEGGVNKISRPSQALGRLTSQQSKNLKNVLRQLKPFQVWDWLFKSCEVNGRTLLREGLINVEDIADCVLKGSCKKLSIKLPAWCILQCLLKSAKFDAHGLLLSEEVEVSDFNWPKDKVLQWFIGPLLIMKEQIKELKLNENEEACLGTLVMAYETQRPEDWNNSEFPTDDTVRRAQLQAIIRRLQGIVVSLSRMPTYRRRFLDLVKVLYLEAVKTGALNQEGSSSKRRNQINKLVEKYQSTESTASNRNANAVVDNLDRKSGSSSSEGDADTSLGRLDNV